MIYRTEPGPMQPGEQHWAYSPKRRIVQHESYYRVYYLGAEDIPGTYVIPEPPKPEDMGWLKLDAPLNLKQLAAEEQADKMIVSRVMKLAKQRGCEVTDDIIKQATLELMEEMKRGRLV